MALPTIRNAPGARYQNIDLRGVSWRDSTLEWTIKYIENGKTYIWNRIKSDGSALPKGKERWISLYTYHDFALARERRLKKQSYFKTGLKVGAVTGGILGAGAILGTITDAKSAQQTDVKMLQSSVTPEVSSMAYNDQDKAGRSWNDRLTDFTEEVGTMRGTWARLKAQFSGTAPKEPTDGSIGTRLAGMISLPVIGVIAGISFLALVIPKIKK